MLAPSLGSAGMRAVEIVEADYEGRSQFKVTTASATWFYDKAGGGFSRLVDREGRDWISFHRETQSKSPASAAASYRGIPNCVFGKENPDDGAGHPGFERCVSERVGLDSIRTTSKSGVWAWTWRFTDTHALFTMEKADPARAWWFLYEGSVAGRFAPREQYWGTDQGGPRHETPDHLRKEDITGRWHWIYFGDRAVHRVLVIAPVAGPSPGDVFSYMANTRAGILAPEADGMVVFGFGRGTTLGAASLRGARLQFVVGLLEAGVTDAAAHAAAAAQITEMINRVR